MSHIDDLRFYYADQPHEVSIETQALCNARCTFCPYPTLERIGTKMSDDMLARVMDEFTTFTKPFLFSPFKVNEPLLDKRLIPLCQEFNRRVPIGVLRLFSNGSALTDKNIEGIAGLERVAHLWISLNEHDPVEYEKTMGLNFAHTTRNLDRLHGMVSAGEFPHEVVVSRVGVNQAFLDYCRKRWPKFSAVQIKRDAWIDYTTPFSTEVPSTPCVRWWELNFTATGKASLCCMDGEARFGFGDLNDSTMLEIYNHPTFRKWRVEMMDRKDAGDPCARCSY